MTYHCELIERQAQPILAIRRRASVRELPAVLPEAWGAIMQHAAKANLQPSGPPFVAYRNMDMQDLDVEIGFPFPGEITGEGEIVRGEIAGGRAAACLHTGPYDQVTAAYEALQTWMTANGHAPSGVAYEFYLNDPGVTPPAELKTQILFPLK